MVRSAVKRLLIGLLLLTLVGSAAAAPSQQSGALLPAIVDFTADATSLNYADVEAGTTQITFSWHTINTNGQYRVIIDSYAQSSWTNVLGNNETLPLSGSQKIAVTPPEGFGVPTYRLTLKTNRGGIVDQQFLTIPYAASAQSTPSIVSFTTMAKALDINQIVQSNAHLIVRWQIANRQPNTLIHFEEVMPDGSTVSVEPPRQSLWLPSQGQGDIVPHATPSKDSVDFRMVLTDPLSGAVLDQKDLIIPIVGQVVLAPSNAQQTQAETVHPDNTQVTNNQSDNSQNNDNQSSGNNQTTSNPQTQTLAASQPTITGDQIQNFSAESAPAQQGGVTTLTWDAGNAASVDLLADQQNGPTTLYIELPPSGSLQLPVPEGSPNVTYTLRAENADGQVSTGQVNVTQTQSSDQTNGGG